MSNKLNYEEYGRKMRLAVSPGDIINKNGDINHQYFCVKKGTYWSEAENKKFLEAIQQIGMGNWRQIRNFDVCLKEFTELELELRGQILLCVNDTQEFQGQKLGQDEIKKIQQAHIAEGKQKNKLKEGVYMKY